MPAVQPIPADYPRLIPYLVMQGAADAIRFYETVFAAKKRGGVLPGPDGTVGHAELQIGDSVLMLADPDAMRAEKTAQALGGSPVNLCLYVEDADAVVARAVAAGAKVTSPLEDKFYGDRAGTFEDPWGYQWTVMTRVEEVSEEEMGRRLAGMMQQA